MEKSYRKISKIGMIISFIIAGITILAFLDSDTNVSFPSLMTLIYGILLLITGVLLAIGPKNNKKSYDIATFVISILTLNVIANITSIFGYILHSKDLDNKDMEIAAENEIIKEKKEKKIKDERAIAISIGVKVLFVLSIIISIIYMGLYIFVLIKFTFPYLQTFFESVMNENNGWPLWNVFMCFFYGFFIIIFLSIPFSIYINIISYTIATLKLKKETMLIILISFGFITLTIFNSIGAIIVLKSNKKIFIKKEEGLEAHY